MASLASGLKNPMLPPQNIPKKKRVVGGGRFMFATCSLFWWKWKKNIFLDPNPLCIHHWTGEIYGFAPVCLESSKTDTWHLFFACPLEDSHSEVEQEIYGFALISLMWSKIDILHLFFLEQMGPAFWGWASKHSAHKYCTVIQQIHHSSARQSQISSLLSGIFLSLFLIQN